MMFRKFELHVSSNSKKKHNIHYNRTPTMSLGNNKTVAHYQNRDIKNNHINQLSDRRKIKIPILLLCNNNRSAPKTINK